MTTTALVQIGDFHAAADARRADRYAALDRILEDVEQLPALGAILWPGDLFDAASDPDDRNALDARLQRAAGLAPVVLCPGNHDRPGDLDGFARLQSSWPITVIDRPGCIRIRLAAGGNATIFVLPYPHKGGLVGAGVPAGDVVPVAGELLDPIFIQAAAELEAAAAEGDLTLMIGHVNIAGAMTSTGQPNIGREIELPARLLDRLGPIYKGLNHIHFPQTIAGAWYAGSVVAQNYGETEAKRYLVVEFTATGRTVNRGRPAGPWSYEVRSVPIATAPMYLVEGELETNPPRFGIAVDADPDIWRRFTAGEWSGCDVRVRYHYQASQRPLLGEARAWLAERFATALRVKVEGIARPDRDLRAPAVAAAKTLPDKLAAYGNRDELETSVADKLQALEAQDGAAVLAAVERALQALEAPPRPLVVEAIA